MTWLKLENNSTLEEIYKKSKEKPQVIFKHSTRCSISSMAKSRLERSPMDENIDFYYLDLIAHRDISRKIADEMDVYHESPQVLVIKDGICVYDESHSGISMSEIISHAN
ncbi:MAG: bacillithiol system redox-active protein YtxJ [Ferruginibacter sp.]